MEYSLPELCDIHNIPKEELLDEKLILAFFEIKDPVIRTRYEIGFRQRAKDLKIGPEFKKLLESYASQAKEILKSDKAAAEISIEQYGTYNCAGWTISEKYGIKSYNLFGGEIIACYHIIIPIRRFINIETNEEMVTLAYKRQGEEWREIIVKRDIIANASKITSLAAKGIAITSENAKALVRFLSDFENANYESIKTDKSTSRMGWHKGFFVPIESKDILFDGEAKFKAAYDALEPSGSYEAWLEFVKKLRARGRFDLNIYLVASFASILIETLGTLPFILDVFGPSGRGKTVALMMACSVWANPREGEYISGANSTITALEQKLNFLNNLPLLLDDMATLKKRNDEDFSDFIYRVCAGQGRARSNINLTIDALTRWSNITLTNAERPLVDSYTKGGAVNRVIDIPMGDGFMFDDGHVAAAFFRENYGHAGKHFVEILHKIGREKVNELFEEKRLVLNKLMEETETTKEEKQILPMAALLAADQILTDELFQDGIYLDAEKGFDVLKGNEEVSENERAWQYLVDCLEANRSKFATDSHYEETIPDKWGIYRDKTFHILKSKLDERLVIGGFSPELFLKWAYENKKVDLVIGKRGGIQGKVIKAYSGLTFRGISIPDPGVIKPETDKDGFIKVDETDDGLPF